MTETTSPIKVALALNELEGQKTDKARFLSSYHGNQRKSRMKPVHSFRNWTRYFKIPYFCFIDIAVFSFYIIFAVFHENSSISFSVDLENAIHSFINTDMLKSKNEYYNFKGTNPNSIHSNNQFYNTNGKSNTGTNKVNQNASGDLKSKKLQIIDPPIGIPFGEGQIFLINDFIYMLDESTNKLFQFSTRFPMSHPILDYGYVTLMIKLLNGTVIEHVIKRDDENRRKIKNDEEATTKNSFPTQSNENDFEITEKSFLSNKIRFKTKVRSSNNKQQNNEFTPQNSNFNQYENFNQNSKQDFFYENYNFNSQNNILNQNENFNQNIKQNNLNKQSNKINKLNKNNDKKEVKDQPNQPNMRPSDYVIPYLMDFAKVSVSMSYHLQIIGTIFDSRINLEIISDFERDLRTDTIIFDIYHTRFQEKTASLFKVGTALYTFNYSLPIVIALLNIIAIYKLIKESIYDLYWYSKRKSDEVGQVASFIFSKKFDKWTLYAIFTHFTSIVAMVLYIFIGQNIGPKVPPISIFLSIATFNHSILLIRYLNLKDTTFLIITVLYKSSLILVKFLLGCFPFFFAFWVFGICFFGHLSFIFASPLECASYLFCVMHGDSILAFFDNTIIQNDYNWVLGFTYTAMWIMFSLLLVFNITISIFQDVLRQENAKLSKKNEDEQNHKTSPLHLDFLTNNIRLMMNANQYKNPNAFQGDAPPA